MKPVAAIHITLPEWAVRGVDFQRTYATDEERMRLAVDLARENVRQGSGGPFGAAIFESVSGRLVAVGVNRVVPLNNSVLHAEMVAFMLAQASAGSYTLSEPGMPEHELFTSCEPCAMCLGATPWSGVRRVVWAATRDDAGRLSFDEGPVFQATYDYLAARGIRFQPGPLRAEARQVLAEYSRRGGEIYNG
jgi:tRNA(Arg) A34 adenosine deaminase TadA